MVYSVLLTQNSTPIFKYIVWVLGKIMEGIFYVFDRIGIPNIGLAIILFTIIVNIFMLPLTYKQQKFSKLSAKMQPEIKAVQKKYEGKRDQDSAMKQNAEIQAVYAKYGVSPTGSCAYLLIQAPIMFALYRVIYAIPAYVTKIGNVFRVLAAKIISSDNAEFLQNSGIESIASNVRMYSKNLAANLENGVIDVLYRSSQTDVTALSEHYGLAGLEYDGQLILSNGNVKGLIDTYNNFLGLNISNHPWDMMKSGFSTGSYLIAIAAILIPVLSGFTQWLSIKLAPQAAQQSSGDAQADQMASQMKMMNNIMPLFSVWIGFTLPAGLGIYWIANAVVRCIIQIIMNKKIDQINFEELINQNKGKSAKKLEKLQAQQEKLNAYANMNTRNIQAQPRKTIQQKASYNNSASAGKEEASAGSGTTGRVGSGEAKPGSMLAKANLVKDFNEKNNRK